MALDNNIIGYIEEHYDVIEQDMNNNNSLSKTRKNKNKEEININIPNACKTRKKREELSVSAIKTFKKEKVEITITFD